MKIDGKELMCGKHDLDYRICCEECQAKHAKFSDIVKSQIAKNQGLDKYL